MKNRIMITLALVCATLVFAAQLCAAPLPATVFHDDFSSNSGAWTPDVPSAWTLGGGVYTGAYAGATNTMTNVAAPGVFTLDVDLTWLGTYGTYTNYGVGGFILQDTTGYWIMAVLNIGDNDNATLMLHEFDPAGNFVVYGQSATATTVGNSFHLELSRPAGTTDALEILLTGDVNGGSLYMYKTGYTNLNTITQNGLRLYLSDWAFDNYHLATVVPEPTSIVSAGMMLSVVGGMFLRRRKR